MKTSESPSRWLIVADDLTGAADCGIAFAKAGIATVVGWGEDADGGDAAALAIDVDSRRFPAKIAADRQKTALTRHYRPGLAVYKKIDSTLRGQPAAELAATLALLADRSGGRAPLAVVAPAFPGTGRATLDGRITMGGVALEETPLWARDHSYANAFIPDVLASAGLPAGIVPLAAVRESQAVVRDRLADARRKGLAAMVCDAANEADLAVIAAASWDLDDAPLWVGSGGLAAHLARLSASGEMPPAPTPSTQGPVLVVVGSLAEASRQQAAILGADIGMVAVRPDDLLAGPGCHGWDQAVRDLHRALAAGQDVLLEIAAAERADLKRGPEMAGRLALLVEPVAPAIGALVATGGETACALLSRLGVHGIRLVDEVEPGVPLGVTLGRHRFPVVTKAGAFGGAETLRRCVERLHGR